MTAGSSLDSPFIAGPMIRNPRLFIGRQEVLQQLANYTNDPPSRNVNVVGEPHIGKSSLLYHFFQTWEQRVTAASHYGVIYLSLQESRCQTETGLYRTIAQELIGRPVIQTNSALLEPFQVKPFDRAAFSAAMKHWQQQGVLPVLCLDEFEALFCDRTQFNNAFYNTLQELIELNAIVTIVASQQPLNFYSQQYQLASSFFSQSCTLTLTPFSQAESLELVRLSAPSATVSNPTAQPILQPEHQQLALEWGKQHPHLLQLAASLLYQAQHQQQGTHWAKTQFLAATSQFKKTQLTPKAEEISTPEKNSSAPQQNKKIARWQQWSLGLGIVALTIVLLLGLIAPEKTRKFFETLNPVPGQN